ncbi:MAG: hypothetical protein C0622_14590 [Desulfuromonas sp.]|nr:MAG: hypothetical protein C0622_14590 [Desulfuromonas sp.]
MKKVILILLCLSLAVPALAAVESYGEKYDKVVEIFQSLDEEDALDAIWDSETLLKIGVFDHDKDYTNYASHACDVIKEQELEDKEIMVQVIDLSQLIQAEEWKVLGEAVCR